MKRTQRTLTECCQQGDGLKAGPGLLQGVKVCGMDSANGRKYLPEALKAALPLYEGVMVNIDHPDKAEQPRSLNSRFGQLVNVRMEDGGPRADLQFNPKHPLAEMVQWWAENNPRCLGLSHNALGSGRNEGGTFVVEKILAVRSVDLVADPATTKGLFESKGTTGVKKTIAKILEALSRPKRAIVNRLIEADYMDPDAEMDMPADAGDAPDEDDHVDALRGGFEAAAVKMIGQILDGSLEMKAGLKKLKDMLVAHGKLTGDGDAEDEPVGEEEDDNMDDTKDAEEAVKAHPAFKAIQSRLDKLEAVRAVEAKQHKAAQLCKGARLPAEAVTPVFLEQLALAADDRGMKALIEDRKAALSIGKPKSSPAGTVVAGVSEQAKLTDEQFLAALRR